MSVRGFNTGSGVEQYDYEYLDNKPEIPTKKSDIGLGNVDNTSDLDKPISTAMQTALNEKVPNTRKVNGKALSADVSITSEDIGYDASTAYGSGTVGKELTELNRQISDVENAFGEVTEAYPSLANVDDVLIGYNWTQGSATNRAIIWVPCLPNTDYFIRVPTSTAFNDVSIVQKAEKNGGALSSSTIQNGSEQTFTTVATAAFICVQFNGRSNIVSSDFDNYDLYLIQASHVKTAVDEVARSAKNKKYIFIGDSYCEGYNPDGNTTGWGARLKSAMNLADEECCISCQGGTGFYHVSDGKTFSTLLDEAGTKVIKSAITDIVVGGGWNDSSEAVGNIYNAVLSFIAKVRTEYQNAKLHIGMIGASNNSTIKQNLQNVLYAYQYAAGADVCNYMNNVEYALSESNLASDGIHPNADGQVQITISLKQALLTGSAYIPYRFYNQIKTS